MILVISDLHFGVEPTSDARETTVGMEKLLSFIKKRRPRKIIFLGDLFDFYRCDVVDAIEAGRRKFLERLDRILEGFPCTIIYVVGNHDHFFRQMAYMEKTLKRIEGGIETNEIDETLIDVGKVPFARKVLRSLLPHAKTIEAKYPFHIETTKEKTFFFEHGDYTDYLFFYGGGWERYLYPLLKREEKRTNLPHAMEYLESVASIRNTASYYQKIEEHLHATLESIQRNMVVTERRRMIARLILFSSFLFIFILLPILFWTFGILSIVLATYFFALAVLAMGYLIFRERMLQKLFGFFLKLFLDAFGPRRGERIEELVSGRFSSKMFKLKKRKNYFELLSDRAGCTIDFYIFGHTHYAGFAFYKSLCILNAGCWSVPNSDEANRLADKYRNAKNKDEIEERLYDLAEKIGDWREAKTLLLIEDDKVSLISLHDGEVKFSQPF